MKLTHSPRMFHRAALLSMLGCAAQVHADDLSEFKRLDISGNGYLSGTELDAGDTRSRDGNGDGRVTDQEFLAGRAAQTSAMPAPAKPAAAAERVNAAITLVDGLPRLPGTGWKIEAKGNVGVQVFLFCKSGRWEVVSSHIGGYAPMGTYVVNGAELVTTNADGGQVARYKMRWLSAENILEIDDGTVLRLYAPVLTQCN